MKLLPVLAPTASRKAGGSGTVKPGAVRTAPSPLPDSCTGRKFIDGLPMNPATNLFRGWSYSSCGAPTCWSFAWLMTAMR